MSTARSQQRRSKGLFTGTINGTTITIGDNIVTTSSGTTTFGPGDFGFANFGMSDDAARMAMEAERGAREAGRVAREQARAAREQARAAREQAREATRGNRDRAVVMHSGGGLNISGNFRGGTICVAGGRVIINS